MKTIYPKDYNDSEEYLIKVSLFEALREKEEISI